ncbi:Electron transport complex, RnfG [Candidatus Magnetoovum chiemensis]|nr:Electron transport complex, RnfG [Candidatus Magnetoovum chiemensis]
MKNILKLITVLTIICGVAAVGLAVTFIATKKPIEEQFKLKTIKAISSVYPDLDLSQVYDINQIPICAGSRKNCDTIYEIKKDGKTAAFAAKVIVKGYGGDIEVMAGAIADDKISGVKILRHSETPGLGANITKGGTFEAQFRGKSKSAGLKKQGGELDQVTGATISSKAVVSAARKAVETISDYKMKH